MKLVKILALPQIFYGHLTASIMLVCLDARFQLVHASQAMHMLTSAEHASTSAANHGTLLVCCKRYANLCRLMQQPMFAVL